MKMTEQEAEFSEIDDLIIELHNRDVKLSRPQRKKKPERPLREKKPPRPKLDKSHHRLICLLVLHGFFTLAAAALAVGCWINYQGLPVINDYWTLGGSIIQIFGLLAPLALVTFAVLLRLRKKVCFAFLCATLFLELGTLTGCMIPVITDWTNYLLSFLSVLLWFFTLTVSLLSLKPIKAHLEDKK